jgi:hypothetical protein
MTTLPLPATRRRLGLLLLAAGVGATAACGSSGAPARSTGTSAATGQPTGRANSLSQEEIRRSSLANAYDIVSTLRPRWMQTRGADSFQRPTEVQVYVDNTRLSNGINGLREISSLAISKIEWVNPIDAAARWGLDHGQGAIVVITSAR